MAQVAWWLTRKLYLRAGDQPSKPQHVEGEILISQSIQLGFSRSLGSAISNEANKSAMWRAERTIAARSAVLRLAQIKYRYFVSEHCKQNAVFSGTSHQNKAYLDNVSTNQWYIVGFRQGHCISKYLMKISRYLRQYCRYWLQNFTVTLFQLYAKDNINGPHQRCTGLSHCKIIAAKLGHRILPEFQWVWLTRRC